MIRLSLAELVFVYLLVFLAAIFLVWIAYEMVRRFRENRSRANRLHCAICAFEYQDASSSILPRCPRCGSLNERTKLNVH